jgi:wyosine [tRNA(Phe)-imidazoG37] synthetase (radical SAM superfamily)
VRLSIDRHDRDRAGLVHVYPVVSRRSRGLSVGINLNPNNACNFRCVYCQVPGLVFGKAPEIDLALLERELRGFLEEIVHGDFMERAVPEGSRRLNDVAFSGNGEPTSAPEFDRIVELVGRILRDFELLPATKLVLITNGSLVNQDVVRRGLERMRSFNGEVWFKLDSATDEGLARIDNYRGGFERHFANLALASRLCPTWIQTCVFARNGAPPSEDERAAYLRAVERIETEQLPVEGVLLYGLARPSHQPEAPELSALPAAWLEQFAQEIRARGLEVRVSV